MITTFTGPMHSSKSETMIKYYNKIYNKDSILVFKPKVDTRDEGIIRSKGKEASRHCSNCRSWTISIFTAPASI